ncbi:hypothetical protein BC829DRAFT_223361 [Chytridium lagenaria]|nr:hypothetical protein BC829DRAFT_223361 [Chytridium lagenaria]
MPVLGPMLSPKPATTTTAGGASADVTNLPASSPTPTPSMPYSFGQGGGGLASSSLLLPSPSSSLFERSMGALFSNLKGSLGYDLFMDAPGSSTSTSTPSGLRPTSTNGSSTLFGMNGSSSNHLSASSSSTSLPDLGSLLSPYPGGAQAANGPSDVLRTFFVSSSSENHISHNAASPPALLAPTAPSDRTISRSSTAPTSEPPSQCSSPTPPAPSTISTSLPPPPMHLLTAPSDMPSLLSPNTASFLGLSGRTPSSSVPGSALDALASMDIGMELGLNGLASGEGLNGIGEMGGMSNGTTGGMNGLSGFGEYGRNVKN